MLQQAGTGWNKCMLFALLVITQSCISAIQTTWDNEFRTLSFIAQSSVLFRINIGWWQGMIVQGYQNWKLSSLTKTLVYIICGLNTIIRVPQHSLNLGTIIDVQ